MSSASSSCSAPPSSPPPPAVGPWQLEGRLGSGSFGQVFSARHAATGERVAVKRCCRFAPETAAEVNALRALKGHPSVVRLLDVVHVRESTYIVEELVDGPDLFDFVQLHGGAVPAAVAKDVARQLLDALRFVHSRGFLHRDVKLENVVVAKDGRVKLVDFGLAAPFDRSSRFTGAAGSVRYAAPTVLESAVRGVPYGADGGFVDTYSTGVVVFGLLCGVWPFLSSTVEGLWDEVLASYSPTGEFSLPFPSGCAVDPLAKHFVRHLMDCRVRSTAEAALQHPWLADETACDPAPAEAQGAVLKKDASAGVEGLPKLSSRRKDKSPVAWLRRAFGRGKPPAEEEDARPDLSLTLAVPPVPPPKPARMKGVAVGG
ncbi:kinase-like domain-containing protein [Hyaloraphidium curvatum]|nr:kinase-like domain-containing protein [Hyaloraphidium curvatum]